eukprot:UN12846
MKLSDLMDDACIVNKQVYKSNALKSYEATINMHKQSNTSHTFDLSSMNIFEDCDPLQINDGINEILQRDWKNWEYDVSHKSFVIGKKTNIDVPQETYGLFAVENIPKHTVLSEFTGCVKPIGTKSNRKHNLFCHLIGHLGDDQSTLFWEKITNKELLIIDSSEKHNECIYLNYGQEPNVALYEVLVNKWPHVFVVTIHDIKQGEKLFAQGKELMK